MSERASSVGGHCEYVFLTLIQGMCEPLCYLRLPHCRTEFQKFSLKGKQGTKECQDGKDGRTPDYGSLSSPF